jgi:hypothetical protein
MIVDTHISVEEGEAMGIPAKSTRSYWEAHDLLDSELRLRLTERENKQAWTHRQFQVPGGLHPAALP